VGRVALRDISGWEENPRIEIQKLAYKDRLGRSSLTQLEILDMMKSEPSFRLKELSQDILKNGLQRPLILSFDGRLLDGNRRFFAMRFAMESLDPMSPDRRELEVVDAWVLADGTDPDDAKHVLVDANFAPSLKIEWPDYVKALEVRRLHRDQGLTEEQIAKGLSWPKSKVRETIRIQEIIDEFLVFAQQPATASEDAEPGLGMSETDAIKLAAERYQFFNEAQKSFWSEIRSDYDFKIVFFRWVADGKFGSFAEVRVAHKAYKMPEARAALEREGAGAGKSAKAIVEYNDRVVKSGSDAEQRILSFVEFLRRLDADTIKGLPSTSVDALEESLATVSKMNRAVAP
jgi:hypothetical protein